MTSTKSYDEHVTFQKTVKKVVLSHETELLTIIVLNHR